MAHDHPGYEDYAGPMIKRNGVCNCTTGAHDGPHATWCMIDQHAPTSDGCEQTGTHEKCCGTMQGCLGGHIWVSNAVCCPHCGRRASYSVTGDRWAPARDFKKESAERKAAPLWSGVMLYFPDALLAVARLSKKANDKHNPGEPLHWSKEKSNDHGDCIARHQLNPEEMDEEVGEIHAVMVAWRALAQLQTIIERQHGK